MKKMIQEPAAPAPRIPVSTYRLQFNHQFRFSDALKIIPYLHELGITDIYASPYFKAQKGSTHGYDIVDPAMFNPEVGTEDDYDAMVRELGKYGMGQLLDIVPNHMSIGSENPWWMEGLENIPSGENTDITELLSIITSIKHLPPYTETDTERIAERYREKELPFQALQRQLRDQRPH